MVGLERLRRMACPITGHAAVHDLLLGVAASAVAVWALTQAFPGVPVDAGSVTLRVAVVPSLHGGVTIQAPPLGELAASSFTAPARVVARADSIHIGSVDPLLRGVSTPRFEVPDDVDLARVVGLAVLIDAVAAALLGALLALALRLPRTRVVRVATAAAAVVVAVGLLGVLTHRSSVYDEPQRTGAWAALPELDTASLTSGRIEGALGEQLARFGFNLTGFYTALTSDARSFALRDDSRVVLVVPADLPSDVLAAAREWFDPDLVTDPSRLSVPEVVASDGGVRLADGQVAPLGMSEAADGALTADLVVLYLDPDTDQLHALDQVTLDGDSATLARLTVDADAGEDAP